MDFFVGESSRFQLITGHNGHLDGITCCIHQRQTKTKRRETQTNRYAVRTESLKDETIHGYPT